MIYDMTTSFLVAWSGIWAWSRGHAGETGKTLPSRLLTTWSIREVLDGVLGLM